MINIDSPEQNYTMTTFWWTYLNWQKMSAYSAEMLEACRTVTLKVNTLPILRCSKAVSSVPSRLAFNGFSSSSAPADKYKIKIRHRLRFALQEDGQVETVQVWWGFGAVTPLWSDMTCSLFQTTLVGPNMTLNTHTRAKNKQTNIKCPSSSGN